MAAWGGLTEGQKSAIFQIVNSGNGDEFDDIVVGPGDSGDLMT